MADSSPLFRHILAPIDGSQPAVQAGKMAVRLAALHQCELTFAYVVDDSVAEELSRTSKKNAGEIEQELMNSGQRSLDYLGRLASEAGVNADEIIRRGDPCNEITNLANEKAVDLIVIGQVGSRGLRRVLIGCVTERVIEYARCPVLVVKKPA
jgi:nucleotide-binding universal stress UspA family protein